MRRLMDEIEGIPHSITAPCGNKAYFDRESGCGYRCSSCFAVVGSVGMPRECEDAGRAAQSDDASRKREG